MSSPIAPTSSTELGINPLSSVLSPELSNMHIRPFEHKDALSIHKLYLECNTEGVEGSPIDSVLRIHLTAPSTILNYGVFGLGLGLVAVGFRSSRNGSPLPFVHPTTFWDFSPVVEGINSSWISLVVTGFLSEVEVSGGAVCLRLGLLVSGAALYNWVIYRIYIRKAFDEYCQASLNDDLKDIGGYYMGWKATERDAGESGLARPASWVNGFWVAEDKVTGEVMGCVGVDMWSSPDPTTLELRRMLVSPRCRRKGLGHALIDTVMEYVKSLNEADQLKPNKARTPNQASGSSAAEVPHPRCKKILLQTTIYQQPAAKLYESHGWKKVGFLKYRFQHWWLGALGYAVREHKMELDVSRA